MDPEAEPLRPLPGPAASGPKAGPGAEDRTEDKTEEEPELLDDEGREYDPVEDAYAMSFHTKDPGVLRAKERTQRGLLAMMIGFAISWIPLVQAVGGILLVVGVVWLIQGRKGYGALHRRSVMAGGAMLFVATVATVVVTLQLIFSLSAQAQAPGMTAPAFAGLLQGEFDNFVLAIEVLGVLALLAEVVLVYGLATHESLMLLGVAFCVSVLFLLFGIGYVQAQVNSTLSAIANGSQTFGSTTLDGLQTSVSYLTVMNVIPDLLFLLAYRRVRRDAREKDHNAEDPEAEQEPGARSGSATLRCPECRTASLVSLAAFVDEPPYYCDRCGYTGMDALGDVSPSAPSASPKTIPPDPGARSD